MSDKIELNKELKLKALEIISKAANYQSILAEADRTGSGSIRTSNLCMHIKFKDDFFKFYIETCGQKGHYIVPYIGNGQEIKNEYIRLLFV